MSFSPARREEICRLARQISSHSLQLRDIVDAIYNRAGGARDSVAFAPPPPEPSCLGGVSAQSSVTSGRSRRASSRAAPQDFCVNTRVSSGGGAGGKGGETKQSLRLQLPASMGSQFMAQQNMDTGDVSVRQSLSGSLDSEGPKMPTTTHISRRPKPPKTEKAKLDEPEPDHPRPYEDDPIWEVWESNMLRLIQLLKMLLNELRNVSEYTKFDVQDLVRGGGGGGMGGGGQVITSELLNNDVLATKVAASTIIGGLHNRENVSNALNNPPPFQQLYPPQQTVKSSSQDRLSSVSGSTGPRERIDLSVYFRKLANQMDALTQALKPNPFPPHAGAPMADRLIPLEENVGRLAHNLAGVSRAIARPVDPLDALMSSRAGSVSCPMAGQRQVQLRTEAQMDDEGLISMANRANVSFQLDKSPLTSQQSSSAACGGGGGGQGKGYNIQSETSSPLVASVNRLTEHMNDVHDLFRKAIGARPVPKATKEAMTISEEEDLRYCINRLTDNMCKISQDLRRAMEDHTTVAASRLVDEAYYEDD